MIDETTFVDVTFWGRTAEVAAEYLSKGFACLHRRPPQAGYLGEGRPEELQVACVCDRMQLIGARGESNGPRQSGGGSIREEYAEARSATIESETGHGGGYGGDDIPF